MLEDFFNVFFGWVGGGEEVEMNERKRMNLF